MRISPPPLHREGNQDPASLRYGVKVGFVVPRLTFPAPVFHDKETGEKKEEGKEEGGNGGGDAVKEKGILHA